MLLATPDGKALARASPLLPLPSLAESEAAALGWQLARKGARLRLALCRRRGRRQSPRPDAGAEHWPRGPGRNRNPCRSQNA